MGGCFQFSERQARKRALAAECEVYRLKLRMELENIALNAAQARQRFSQVRRFNPYFILGMPAIGFFFRRIFPRKREIEPRLAPSRSKLSRTMATAAIGWRLLWKLAPLARSLWRRVAGWHGNGDQENPKLWSQNYTYVRSKAGYGS